MPDGLPATELAIRVRGLTKSYGPEVAVAGIDLDVGIGEVFALLGPNGAGKTTTVEILEGYRRRDHGEVRVLGCDPGSDRVALKPRIGIVLQSTGIEQYLTVRETLAMYADFYPHPRAVDATLELVQLTNQARKRVSRLSGGQQRRLDVGIALIGDPDLVFLDEPTTGFDPAARRDAWHMIKDLAGLGKTILLTTHYMDEAQFLADRVAVMARGRVIAQGSPDTLGVPGQQQFHVHFRVPPEISIPDTFVSAAGPDGVDLRTDHPERILHELTGWALRHDVVLTDLRVSRPSLEETYLALIEARSDEQQAAGGDQ